jgi:hypothetical protein
LFWTLEESCAGRVRLYRIGEAVLFLPQKIKRVRGLFVTIAWGLGFEAYDLPEFRRLAETLEFGVLRARIRFISEPNATLIGPGRIPAKGGAEVLQVMLRHLADDSGHAELAQSPLLFFGHSAAGMQISGLASLLPARTIAYIRYHSGASTADMNSLIRIPVLMVQEKDNVVDTQRLWKSARALGSPWTFAAEPNTTHGDANDLKRATPFLISWITAVVRQRLTAGAAAVRPLDDSSAWLGDLQSADIAPYPTYSGSKADASWLPDETSARAWRDLMRAGR